MEKKKLKIALPIQWRTIGCRVPIETALKLEKLAKKYKTSLSSIVEAILTDGVAQYD